MATREISYGSIQRGNSLPNGDIYVGNYDGLVPHGLGEYMWSDGTLYDGEWEKSKMAGSGCIQWPSGATYEGDFHGGFIDGTGTFRGVDGSVYKGSWRMNKKHGMGRKVYANSDIYEGFWNEGLPDGLGKYAWDNGNIYVGNWKAGKMNGRGVMKWTNGDTFDGSWLNGLAHGKGQYRYVYGTCYIGTWNRGLKDGHGIFYQTGTKIPSLEASESISCHDGKSLRIASSSSIEQIKSSLLFLLRITCDKWRLGRLFQRAGRISNGTAPVFDDNSGDPLSQYVHNKSLSSEEGQQDSRGDKVLVYEREYIQGVLIMERPKNQDLGMLDSSKLQQPMWQKQARGPIETIYKGHKSYYLMLNLQLGIR